MQVFIVKFTKYMEIYEHIYLLLTKFAEKS